jgi:hypothetical protein
MENNSEHLKRVKKAVKNKIVCDKLDKIRNTQNELFYTLTEMLKINANMIQLVSQPIKKQC